MKITLGRLVKRLAARAADSEEVHEALMPHADRSARSLPPEILSLTNAPSPYSAEENSTTKRTQRTDTVFLSSRFRSGSTALWSAFRRLNGVTTYYEPFNERRFFDPQTRGERVDASHLGVEDYWSEYDATAGLDELYREDWIRRQLYMGERAWNPRMKRFIDALIDQSPGRPVLQFNRVDFRLPWLRRHYPESAIVHLYRNPREQWCSFLIDIKEFPRDVDPDAFVYRFYLDRWARDLQHAIPLLRREFIEHPYDLFFLVWKLSWLFGRRYADHSLAFETLIASPQKTLGSLTEALGFEGADVAAMASAISAPREERWKQYADTTWFEGRERYCEKLLDEFLGRSDERDGVNRITLSTAALSATERAR